MKVLYIGSTLRVCGPINQLFALIKYLDRKKFEPIILTLSPEPTHSALTSFQKLGVKINSLKLSRLKDFLVGKYALKKFVDDCHCDIVHTHGIRADIYAAQYLQKYKRITTIHNYPYHDYPMKYGKLLGYFMAEQHLRALRQIDLPVACSNTIGKMLDLHNLNSYVVQNGVDPTSYTPPTQKERLKLRQQLGLPLNQKIFITVGALIERKQPETAIRGFITSQAKERGMLLIVGEGSLRNACEAIAYAPASQIALPNSCIKFTGQVDNVADYLRAADYFISASLSEGLPISVMEALACGLPVCLSDIEPHKEILDLNRQAGVTFPVGDSQALAKQLNKLVQTETKILSQAASEIVDQYLNAEIMSQKYQLIYRGFRYSNPI
ncbi:glycosyltransferase family 4 protein [Pleurocapsales cyanobacterium LEGE 06147]|nr:glycosyltransferase family 4 protein [Pleurocapsales cyanobacterium LEGE 06147]